MYSAYAEMKDWEWETLAVSDSEVGGYRVPQLRARHPSFLDVLAPPPFVLTAAPPHRGLVWPRVPHAGIERLYHGQGRVRPPQVRDGRASGAARARDRDPGANPHVDGHRRRLARGTGGPLRAAAWPVSLLSRTRDTRGLLLCVLTGRHSNPAQGHSRGHIPGVRPRRPAREQDGQRRARHSRAHRHHRLHPGRTISAQGTPSPHTLTHTTRTPHVAHVCVLAWCPCRTRTER
jgi:hypothetical protein